MALHGTAPALRHALPRGVYAQSYLNGLVYFYVRGDGLEGVWRLPMAHETEDDVIEALMDALDVADPPRRLSSRRSASPAAARAPHLHLHA